MKSQNDLSTKPAAASSIEVLQRSLPQQQESPRTPKTASASMQLDVLSAGEEAPPHDPTAAHLLVLSHSFFATINIRQIPPSAGHSQNHLAADGTSFSCLQPHLAPGMSVEHADAPVYDSSNLLHHFQGMARAHPGLKVEVRNSSVWFYERFASVWCWLEMTGLVNNPNGKADRDVDGCGGREVDGEGLAGRREAVAALFWEKVRNADGEEEWVCTRHKALRSIAGF